MSANVEAQKKGFLKLEKIKWLLVIILITTAIIGNYFFYDIKLPLRLIVTLFLIISALGIVLSTTKGRTIINFIHEAKIEIRKVIWPTNQEALYATAIVLIVTIVMSLILWGIDNILIRLVSFVVTMRF